MLRNHALHLRRQLPAFSSTPTVPTESGAAAATPIYAHVTFAAASTAPTTTRSPQ